MNDVDRHVKQPELNPKTGLPYWGEQLKADLMAEIALLKATAVTHKDFMLWGAALFCTLVIVAVWLNSNMSSVKRENNENTKALYDTVRTKKRSPRIEALPAATTPPPEEPAPQ